jgi:hypothetical protein
MFQNVPLSVKRNDFRKKRLLGMVSCDVPHELGWGLKRVRGKVVWDGGHGRYVDGWYGVRTRMV